MANDSGKVDSVQMYLIEWNKKRRFAVGMRNFREHHEHYFKTDGLVFYRMFDDYQDCVNKLSSRDTVMYDNGTLLNSLIELKFQDGNTVEIFFDIRGNYFFNDSWYKMHDDFYFILFRYFSNLIIPNGLLDEAKRNLNEGEW